MKRLRDLEVFLQAAETGSLSGAARRLNLTPAAASMALKRLEAELGSALFIRSTRSMRLTAAGELFFQHCEQALQILSDGREALLNDQTLLGGVLQLSVSSDLGRNLVLPWLDEFQARYPNIQLRLSLSDRLADIYRQPVDLALRYGCLPDSNLVALPIAPHNRRVLCASPAYLQRYGVPDTPYQLNQHNCLCYLLREQVHDRWRFFSKDQQEFFVNVPSNRQADDGDAVHRWALAGHGIAYKSGLDIADDIRHGRLVPLCLDWPTDPAPLNLVCAERRQLTPLVQELRRFLLERCAALVV